MMDIYVAIKDFKLPNLGDAVSVGTTVSKLDGSVHTFVGSTLYSDLTVYSWVGSTNSLLCLRLDSSSPDPDIGMGPQGAIGFQGVPGSTGEKGDEGDVGPQGLQGDSILGPQGPLGFQGVQGPAGSGGGTGGTGGDTGPQGPQGLRGLQGNVGSAGTNGTQGPQGFQGNIGPQGVGLDGATGSTGPTGGIGSYFGEEPITMGADSVTVLASFGFNPMKVIASVSKTDETCDNLFATVRRTSMGATGFVADLSASAGTTGYSLIYIVGG